MYERKNVGLNEEWIQKYKNELKDEIKVAEEEIRINLVKVR